MLSLKVDLIAKYHVWRGRIVHRGKGEDIPAEEVGVTDMEANNMDAEDKCIHAMMILNPTAFQGEVEEI